MTDQLGQERDERPIRASRARFGRLDWPLSASESLLSRRNSDERLKPGQWERSKILVAALQLSDLSRMRESGWDRVVCVRDD